MHDQQSYCTISQYSGSVTYKTNTSSVAFISENDPCRSSLPIYFKMDIVQARDRPLKSVEG